ncbi:MAG: hypothetical protein JRH20_16785, partial [Deltaproteobacteria bacterium]|nr:hypothetical protein [Deltaproteobacteria bacterium]
MKALLPALGVTLALACLNTGCKNIAGYDSADGDGPRDALREDTNPLDTDGGVVDFDGRDGASGDQDAVIPLRPGQLVTEGGWVWEHPLPQGNTIHAFWGSADNDIWAVGAHGVVLHYDGTLWSAEQVPRWDVDMDHPTLLGIWGADASNVWAVGTQGAVYRWQGGRWQKASSPTQETLRGIWGASVTEIHVVGDGPTWSRLDGTEWTSLPGSAKALTLPLHAIWGDAPTNVWAVGDTNVAYRFNGSEISPLNSPMKKLRAVIGDDGGNLWFGAEAANAQLRHFDGTNWDIIDFGTWDQFNVFGFVRSGWGDKDDVFALGTPRLDTRTGAAVQKVSGAWVALPDPPAQSLISGWGLSNGDLIAAGDDGVLLKHSPKGWSYLGAVSQKRIHDTFQPPDGPLRAVGETGTILRQNNDGSWAKEDSGTTANLYALWGASANDLWAVGSKNTLLHFDGSDWSKEKGPSALLAASLNSIWGSGPSDMWVTANDGEVFHFDGAGWRAVTTGSTARNYAIWGAGPKDVWLVGNFATTCHYDGALWDCQARIAGSNETLMAIDGVSSDQIWAVGETGEVFGYDGTAWTPQLN